MDNIHSNNIHNSNVMIFNNLIDMNYPLVKKTKSYFYQKRINPRIHSLNKKSQPFIIKNDDHLFKNHIISKIVPNPSNSHPKSNDIITNINNINIYTNNSNILNKNRLNKLEFHLIKNQNNNSLFNGQKFKDINHYNNSTYYNFPKLFQYHTKMNSSNNELSEKMKIYTYNINKNKNIENKITDDSGNNNVANYDSSTFSQRTYNDFNNNNNNNCSQINTSDQYSYSFSRKNLQTHCDKIKKITFKKYMQNGQIIDNINLNNKINNNNLFNSNNTNINNLNTLHSQNNNSINNILLSDNRHAKLSKQFINQNLYNGKDYDVDSEDNKCNNYNDENTSSSDESFCLKLTKNEKFNSSFNYNNNQKSEGFEQRKLSHNDENEKYNTKNNENNENSENEKNEESDIKKFGINLNFYRTHMLGNNNCNITNLENNNLDCIKYRNTCMNTMRKIYKRNNRIIVNKINDLINGAFVQENKDKRDNNINSQNFYKTIDFNHSKRRRINFCINKNKDKDNEKENSDNYLKKYKNKIFINLKVKERYLDYINRNVTESKELFKDKKEKAKIKLAKMRNYDPKNY